MLADAGPAVLISVAHARSITAAVSAIVEADVRSGFGRSRRRFFLQRIQAVEPLAIVFERRPCQRGRGPGNLEDRERCWRRADDDERAALVAARFDRLLIRATGHVVRHSSHSVDRGGGGHVDHRNLGCTRAHGSGQHPDEGKKRHEPRKSRHQVHLHLDWHRERALERVSRKFAIACDLRVLLCRLSKLVMFMHTYRP